MNTVVTPLAALAQPSPATAGQWPASLALQFARRGAATRLVRARHEGPLYVQRPFHPEGEALAHVYLLHPPGGIVSGDRLRITVALDAGTAVLCTTPGAGRFYRARADQRLQSQITELTLDGGASLEWFPLETIVYRGAMASQETRVSLAAGACFIGWELVALGLPARGERFDAGSFRQRFCVLREGRPVFIERLALDGADAALLRGAAGLQDASLCGLFVCGPCNAQQLTAELLEALRSCAAAAARGRCAVTVVGDFLVLRYLGACAESARRCFIACWRLLRPVMLDRAACLPRIWMT